MDPFVKQLVDILVAMSYAVAMVVLPTLAVAGAKWLISKSAVAKARLKQLVGDQAFYELERIATIAVLAAEQQGAKKLIKDKFSYAVDIVDNYLANQGIDVDLQTIAAAVQSAVLDEFNRDRYSWQNKSASLGDGDRSV